MSAKEDYCWKNKHQTSGKKNGMLDCTNQFKNINLNHQNYKCTETVDAFLKLGSKSSNNGRKDYLKTFVDSKDSGRLSGKDGFSSSWKKKDISKAFETLNFSSKTEEKNRWKTTEPSESKNKTSSTLSLHIAAYENFVEASETDRNQLEELKSGKTSWKNGKSVLASSNSIPAIQDLFEFPRQNEDRKMKPEVMQFQASQVLLDPIVPRPNIRQIQVQQNFARVGNQLAPQQPVQQPVVHVAAAPLQQPQHLPQNLGKPELHQNLEQQQQQVVPQNLHPPPPASGTAIVNNNIIDHIRQLPPQQPFGAAIQNAIVGNRLPDHNAYFGLLEQINNNQRELIINLMSANLELNRATLNNILARNGNNQ